MKKEEIYLIEELIEEIITRETSTDHYSIKGAELRIYEIKEKLAAVKETPNPDESE